MRTTTVNLSLPAVLLREVDAEARRERRTRSEYVREAVRAQVQHRKNWDRLLAYADANAKRRHITQADVEAAIREVRQGKR